MCTGCAVGFLVLGLLGSLPNRFVLAAPNPNAVEEPPLNVPIFEYPDQDGINSQDLGMVQYDMIVDKPADQVVNEEEPKMVYGEDYLLPVEEAEEAESLDSLEQEDPGADTGEESSKKKRWLWNKKQKGAMKNERHRSGWMFNTAATDAAHMSVVPVEDDRIRNRVAEVYGNQFLRSVNGEKRNF